MGIPQWFFGFSAYQVYEVSMYVIKNKYTNSFLIKVNGPLTEWTKDISKSRPFTRKSSISNFMNRHQIPGGIIHKIKFADN